MRDKKKYPWNKRGDDEPNDVYAGPEYFKGKKEEEPECVYAGPEYFEEDLPEPETGDEAPKPDARTMLLVYAGPTYFPPAQPTLVIKEQNDTKYCAQCGTPLKKSYKFCTSCGAKQPENP